jgi:hypothetical protein
MFQRNGALFKLTVVAPTAPFTFHGCPLLLRFIEIIASHPAPPDSSTLNGR